LVAYSGKVRGLRLFGTDTLPRGLENIGKMGNLAKLLGKVMSKEDVEKIFYRNALRVFMENMKT